MKSKRSGEPKVHCAHDKMVSTAKLKPNPRNPNKHPRAQIELLAEIIKHQGWRAPITVSERSGLIVRGHARLEAAILLGLTSCPVDLQKYETEQAEMADMLADNKIAELAETDGTVLAGILRDMDEGSRKLTGMGEDEIETILAGMKRVQLKIQKPAAMTWCLFCIPTAVFGRIAELVEQLSGDPDIQIEMSVSDAEDEKDR